MTIADGTKPEKIKCVLHLPGVEQNLVSGSNLSDNGHAVEFKNKSSVVKKMTEYLLLEKKVQACMLSVLSQVKRKNGCYQSQTETRSMFSTCAWRIKIEQLFKE